MPYLLESPLQQSETPLTVIGTGEHLYLPFLIAEQLEQSGQDILFQSTTRSPIMMNDAIERKIRFSVANNKVNYIYNLPRDRAVSVYCETPELAAVNGFYLGDFQEED